jgi:hypothetical protein
MKKFKILINFKKYIIINIMSVSKNIYTILSVMINIYQKIVNRFFLTLDLFIKLLILEFIQDSYRYINYKNTFILS